MADDTFIKAIDALETKLLEPLKVVAELKQTINTLCKHAGVPERYPDAIAETEAAKPSLRTLKPDQFVNKALATALGEILEMRRAAGEGPMSVDDLYADLKRWGYDFDSSDEDTAKRALRVSLSKNPKFRRVASNGSYGLAAWYGASKPKKDREDATSEEEADEEAEAGGDAAEQRADPLDQVMNEADKSKGNGISGLFSK